LFLFLFLSDLGFGIKEKGSKLRDIYSKSSNSKAGIEVVKEEKEKEKEKFCRKFWISGKYGQILKIIGIF